MILIDGNVIIIICYLQIFKKREHNASSFYHIWAPLFSFFILSWLTVAYDDNAVGV